MKAKPDSSRTTAAATASPRRRVAGARPKAAGGSRKAPHRAAAYSAEQAPVVTRKRAQAETPALSLAEAAEAAGVTRATITRWIDAERLPGAVKVGRVWRIPAESLKAVAVKLNGHGGAPAEPAAPTPAEPPAPVAAEPSPPRAIVEPEPETPLPLEAEVERLRNEVVFLRERLRTAVGVAEERGRRIEDLKRLAGSNPAFGASPDGEPGPELEALSRVQAQVAALREDLAEERAKRRWLTAQVMRPKWWQFARRRKANAKGGTRSD